MLPEVACQSADEERRARLCAGAEVPGLPAHTRPSIPCEVPSIPSTHRQPPGTSASLDNRWRPLARSILNRQRLNARPASQPHPPDTAGRCGFSTRACPGLAWPSRCRAPAHHRFTFTLSGEMPQSAVFIIMSLVEAVPTPRMMPSPRRQRNAVAKALPAWNGYCFRLGGPNFRTSSSPGSSVLGGCVAPPRPSITFATQPLEAAPCQHFGNMLINLRLQYKP